MRQHQLHPSVFARLGGTSELDPLNKLSTPAVRLEPLRRAASTPTPEPSAPADSAEGLRGQGAEGLRGPEGLRGQGAEGMRGQGAEMQYDQLRDARPPLIDRSLEASGAKLLAVSEVKKLLFMHAERLEKRYWTVKSQKSSAPQPLNPQPSNTNKGHIPEDAEYVSQEAEGLKGRGARRPDGQGAEGLRGNSAKEAGGQGAEEPSGQASRRPEGQVVEVLKSQASGEGGGREAEEPHGQVAEGLSGPGAEVRGPRAEQPSGQETEEARSHGAEELSVCARGQAEMSAEDDNSTPSERSEGAETDSKHSSESAGESSRSRRNTETFSFSTEDQASSEGDVDAEVAEGLRAEGLSEESAVSPAAQRAEGLSAEGLSAQRQATQHSTLKTTTEGQIAERLRSSQGLRAEQLRSPERQRAEGLRADRLKSPEGQRAERRRSPEGQGAERFRSPEGQRAERFRSPEGQRAERVGSPLGAEGRRAEGPRLPELTESICSKPLAPSPEPGGEGRRGSGAEGAKGQGAEGLRGRGSLLPPNTTGGFRNKSKPTEVVTLKARQMALSAVHNFSPLTTQPPPGAHRDSDGDGAQLMSTPPLNTAPSNPRPPPDTGTNPQVLSSDVLRQSRDIAENSCPESVVVSAFRSRTSLLSRTGLGSGGFRSRGAEWTKKWEAVTSRQFGFGSQVPGMQSMRSQYFANAAARVIHGPAPLNTRSLEGNRVIGDIPQHPMRVAVKQPAPNRESRGMSSAFKPSRPHTVATKFKRTASATPNASQELSSSAPVPSCPDASGLSPRSSRPYALGTPAIDSPLVKLWGFNIEDPDLPHAERSHSEHFAGVPGRRDEA